MHSASPSLSGAFQPRNADRRRRLSAAQPSPRAPSRATPWTGATAADCIAAAPGLTSESRVVIGGAALAAALLPRLAEAGVVDVLVADPDGGELSQRLAPWPEPGVLGNALGVRRVESAVDSLPDYQIQGLAAVFLDPAACRDGGGGGGGLAPPSDAVTATEALRASLLRASLLLRPGRAAVVVSAPALDDGPDDAPAVAVPEGLDAALSDLPLAPPSASALTLALAPTPPLALLVPPLYGRENVLPRVFAAPVVPGFGRGSRDLAVPTANLDVDVLSRAGSTAGLGGTGRGTSLPLGVYYGWARLQAPGEGVRGMGERLVEGGEERGGDDGTFVVAQRGPVSRLPPVLRSPLCPPPPPPPPRCRSHELGSPPLDRGRRWGHLRRGPSSRWIGRVGGPARPAQRGLRLLRCPPGRRGPRLLAARAQIRVPPGPRSADSGRYRPR